MCCKAFIGVLLNVLAYYSSTYFTMNFTEEKIYINISDGHHKITSNRVNQLIR